MGCGYDERRGEDRAGQFSSEHGMEQTSVEVCPKGGP